MMFNVSPGAILCAGGDHRTGQKITAKTINASDIASFNNVFNNWAAVRPLH
jgi:hypothetical protein